MIQPRQIGSNAKPFQIIREKEHTIKINNKIEFVESDLKVINGTFGKWTGLNMSKPRITTKTNAILGSP